MQSYKVALLTAENEHIEYRDIPDQESALRILNSRADAYGTAWLCRDGVNHLIASRPMSDADWSAIVNRP